MRRIRTVKLALDRRTAERALKKLIRLVEAVEMLSPRAGLPPDFDPGTLLLTPQVGLPGAADETELRDAMLKMAAALNSLTSIKQIDPKTGLVVRVSDDYLVCCALSRVTKCIQLLHQSLRDITLVAASSHEAPSRRKAAKEKAKARVPRA